MFRGLTTNRSCDLNKSVCDHTFNRIEENILHRIESPEPFEEMELIAVCRATFIHMVSFIFIKLYNILKICVKCHLTYDSSRKHLKYNLIKYFEDS